MEFWSSVFSDIPYYIFSVAGRYLVQWTVLFYNNIFTFYNVPAVRDHRVLVLIPNQNLANAQASVPFGWVINCFFLSLRV